MISKSWLRRVPMLVGPLVLAAGLGACREAGERSGNPTDGRADPAPVRVTPTDTGLPALPTEADTPTPSGSSTTGAVDSGVPTGAVGEEFPASPEPGTPLSDLRRYDTVFIYLHGPIPDSELEGPLVGLPRPVPEGIDALSYALRELLAGPTASEDSAGPYPTWFSGETAGMLRWVTLDEGVATVEFADFRPIISGASSSAGSAMLLRQLKATVFQFPEVRRVEFRIHGSCEEFMAWLQIGCVPIPRSSFAEPEAYRQAVDTDQGR